VNFLVLPSLRNMRYIPICLSLYLSGCSSETKRNERNQLVAEHKSNTKESFTTLHESENSGMSTQVHHIVFDVLGSKWMDQAEVVTTAHGQGDPHLLKKRIEDKLLKPILKVWNGDRGEVSHLRLSLVTDVDDFRQDSVGILLVWCMWERCEPSHGLDKTGASIHSNEVENILGATIVESINNIINKYVPDKKLISTRIHMCYAHFDSEGKPNNTCTKIWSVHAIIPPIQNNLDTD